MPTTATTATAEIRQVPLLDLVLGGVIRVGPSVSREPSATLAERSPAVAPESAS